MATTEVDILIARARRKLALKKKEEQRKIIGEEIDKVDKKVVDTHLISNRALEKATEALEMAKTTSKQKGEKGDDGYTPIKGKDYYTPEEVKEIKKEVTPIKGKDYFDGEDGKDGRDGKDGAMGLRGLPGKDGKDGKNGKDGKDGKDGSPDTPYEIRDKLSSLKGRERLDAKAIKNLSKEVSLVVSGISKPSESGGVSTETDPVFTAWDKDYADLTNKPTIPGDVSELTDTGNVYVDTDGDTMSGDLIGTDFVSTRDITVTRVAGYISQIAKTGGRTLSYTRDVNNYISSVTDDVRTWSFTRDANNYIESCAVT